MAKNRTLAATPGRSGTSTAKASPQRGRGEKSPIFCFHFADRRTKEAWAFAPSADHAPELFEAICNLAKSTWNELDAQTTGGRKRHRKHHNMPAKRLTPAAQDDINRQELTELFGNDVFRFRLGGTKRLWGFRSGRIFHVLWWDPHHKVYQGDGD